jgi:hypothetical protein
LEVSQLEQLLTKLHLGYIAALLIYYSAVLFALLN